MKRVFIFLLFISGWLGCGGGGGGGSSSEVPLLNDACNVLRTSKTVDPKIFSGTECSASASQIVEIIIRFTDGKTGLCSGALLSPRHVLTAGHCFRGDRAAVLSSTVRAGSEEIAVSDFVIDPDYRESQDQAAIFGDAAVVELSRPASAPSLPLLLSRPTAKGDVIDIFGYGIDEAGNLGVLRSGQMLLSAVSLTHLSAAYDGRGSNACLGDSGGPAVIPLGSTPAIVGITSTGKPQTDCKPGDVSLFVNTQDPSVTNFILTNAPETGTI